MKTDSISTLSIENTFNNCCVSMLNSRLDIYFNRETTFKPSENATQDSLIWNQQLLDYHMVTLPILLDEAVHVMYNSNLAIDFVSLSIVKDQINANVEIAKGIVTAFAQKRWEIIEVDHLESHVESVKFLESPPSYPYIALLVAGGNSNLYLAEALGKYTLLGSHKPSSRNRYGHGRAVGAVLDKSAVLLGIVNQDQPDGAIQIDRISQQIAFSNFYAFHNIKGLNTYNDFNFDFHTVYETLEKILGDNPTLAANAEYRQYLATSIQDTLMQILVDKTFHASQVYGIEDIAIVGGVSANSRLRLLAHQRGEALKKRLYFAPRNVSGDNALMIGLLGLMQKRESER